MLRPRRLEREGDPGPVLIHARKVAFDVSQTPLHWIPGHPVASNMISLFNVALPAAERWVVTTFNEALPLVKDPKLADDMRGFIGQEATHADTHERVLHEFMVARGVDPRPMLDQVEYVFSHTLAPTTSTDPKRRLNNLSDRLWLIAGIEHYTAVMGDFCLNSSWDDHGADPAIVDLFRWHGSEEMEHRHVAHDVATYFRNSYLDRIRSMLVAAAMIAGFLHRGYGYLSRTDPELHLGFCTTMRLRHLDSKIGLLPTVRKLLGSATLAYFRPGFSPEEVGSTAQAVAYLASSPAARAASL
jgi:predicted metal-dependent hydrolase